jgi:hypothetical protein
MSGQHFNGTFVRFIARMESSSSGSNFDGPCVGHLGSTIQSTLLSLGWIFGSQQNLSIAKPRPWKIQ